MSFEAGKPTMFSNVGNISMYEVSWLDSFVDYDKGCFMGQEQTSRIKFRGRPRRLLKTVSDRTQVLEKI